MTDMLVLNADKFRHFFQITNSSEKSLLRFFAKNSFQNVYLVSFQCLEDASMMQNVGK